MGTGRKVADICGLPSDFPLFQANSFLADCRMSRRNPFLVWPKLSKVSLGEEFHWRPLRNTYLLEKVVLVMQEMANFPLSQSWIVPAGLEEEGWSCRTDSDGDVRAFPIQIKIFRFKEGCQYLVQPTFPKCTSDVSVTQPLPCKSPAVSSQEGAVYKALSNFIPSNW